MSSFLRPAIGLALIATTSALTADAVDDALVFRAMTRDASLLATSHPAVCAALGPGPPLVVGSLWATTLAAPYRSSLARATFDVGGPGGARTEVSVLAARNGAGGPLGRWSPSGWSVLDVRAALPGPAAGPVRGLSLMPPPLPAPAAKEAAAAKGK